MKLIIDIPDKAYNRLLEEQHLPNRLDIEWVIVHGKPLNDELQEIRQEIEIQRKGFPPSADYYKAINRSLDIIDKHIKEIGGSDTE